MAQKKADLFSQVNTQPQYKVKETIEEATQDVKKRRPRREPSEEEKAELLQGLHTKGFKGVRLPRVNVGFTADNYEYITVMCNAAGMTATEFINKLIESHKEAHADTYQKAANFRDLL